MFIQMCFNVYAYDNIYLDVVDKWRAILEMAFAELLAISHICTISDN